MLCLRLHLQSTARFPPCVLNTHPPQVTFVHVSRTRHLQKTNVQRIFPRLHHRSKLFGHLKHCGVISIKRVVLQQLHCWFAHLQRQPLGASSASAPLISTRPHSMQLLGTIRVLPASQHPMNISSFYPAICDNGLASIANLTGATLCCMPLTSPLALTPWPPRRGHRLCIPQSICCSSHR